MATVYRLGLRRGDGVQLPRRTRRGHLAGHHPARYGGDVPGSAGPAGVGWASYSREGEASSERVMIALITGGITSREQRKESVS
jgi:hypothetical protein